MKLIRGNILTMKNLIDILKVTLLDIVDFSSLIFFKAFIYLRESESERDHRGRGRNRLTAEWRAR